MKLEIEGQIEEIGKIATYGVGIVVNPGTRESFFVPTTASDVVAIGESGLLYQKVKIVVEFERLL